MNTELKYPRIGFRNDIDFDAPYDEEDLMRAFTTKHVENQEIANKIIQYFYPDKSTEEITTAAINKLQRNIRDALMNLHDPQE